MPSAYCDLGIVIYELCDPKEQAMNPSRAKTARTSLPGRSDNAFVSKAVTTGSSGERFVPGYTRPSAVDFLLTSRFKE
jgi:hypothetical protein